MIFKLILSAALLSLSVFATANSAVILQGDKHVYLVDNNKKEINIGRIHFQPTLKGAKYTLEMNHEVFTDYFLSMKEMKCLEGPELWCHLPYPYQQPRTVTHNDFRWLSHDLLFMFKKKEAFGANFWNGIYYDLKIEGNQLSGIAQAVDLNALASPPENLNQPILENAERDEIDSEQRWLPKMIIR